MPNQTLLQTGWDMTEPAAALTAFLATLPARPQLLGLGEPTHGVQDFPDWRNRILRGLVEHHGFRSIAIESDILAGLRVNEFVSGAPGALDEVMQSGFSHGFGAYRANRELVAWMREFNTERREPDRLRFYGFDAPMENMYAASPRASLVALHAFLNRHISELPVEVATIEQLCAEDARWTNAAAAMDATQSVGRTPEAKSLRLIADDLQTLLGMETPRFYQEPDFWLAELQARTATGLLRYHAIMADPAPLRVSRVLALRDLMMADNLSAIAARELSRGPTLVFAHNTHLQRNRSKMSMPSIRLEAEWWGAGAQISRRLGQQYAFIAATLGTGAGLGEPRSGTLEGYLRSQVTAPRLYATRQLLGHLQASLEKREDMPHTFIPLDPESLGQTEGLLVLPAAQASQS